MSRVKESPVRVRRGVAVHLPGGVTITVAVAWWGGGEAVTTDAMDVRLASAPDADTPLTRDERVKLNEAKAQFDAGEFYVDPATARDRGVEHVS